MSLGGFLTQVSGAQEGELLHLVSSTQAYEELVMDTSPVVRALAYTSTTDFVMELAFLSDDSEYPRIFPSWMYLIQFALSGKSTRHK